MQIPVSWLKQKVNTDLSTAQIAEILTVAGIEVEEVQGVGVYHRDVVVGEVIEVVAIDKEQHVHLLTVNIGKRNIPIVTKNPGEQALTLGAHVALALPGAVVIDASNETFALREVKAGKLYSHHSHGVLVSEKECGIGECNDKVYTPATTAAAGTPLCDLLEPKADWQADEILVIAILANIARCQSFQGVAREFAAITGSACELEESAVDLASVPTSLTPSIEDDALCRRFSCVELTDVNVAPSPAWMQRLLVLGGMEPINNVVDASNYVMLEMGQPSHAYDATKLASKDLTVRFAHDGETFKALIQEEEDEPYTLKSSQPVIVSKNEVVSIAGVVGGASSAINDETHDILLEAANFDFITIRKTQSDMKLMTDAGTRFSRGVNPLLTLSGLARVIALLQETSPQLKLIAQGDATPVAFEERQIELHAQEVNASLGVHFTIAQISKLLNQIGITTATDSEDERLVATVDAWREDITGAHDLIEEVARLYGYDNLPETMPLQPIPFHPKNAFYEWRETARDAMVLWGMQEVMSYSLSSAKEELKVFAGETAVPDTAFVQMTNPLSDERSVLRRSLIPSLCQHAKLNFRHMKQIQLFEIGPVFLPEHPGEAEGLPCEQERLTALLTGEAFKPNLHNAHPGPVDFYDISDALAMLMRHLHIKDYALENNVAVGFHPGQCAHVMHGTKCYGYMGALHPRVAESYGLDKFQTYVIDLDLRAICEDAERDFVATSPLKYPSVELDISIVLDESISAHWVLTMMQKAAREWWVDGSVFDVYHSETLGENKKALAIRFSLNAKSRTLKMEEANKVREDMVSLLGEEFGAVLRS